MEFDDAKSAVRSHFWVASWPFFETTLFLIPAAGAVEEETESEAATIKVHDCDGQLVNELVIESPRREVGCIELDSCLGMVKLEGGLKHAHLVVTSGVGTSHLCRINNRSSAAMLGSSDLFSSGRATFFPALFGADRTMMIALTNHGHEVASAKIRLFAGSKMPETTCVIPPMGSRLVSLEAEFSEVVPSKTVGGTQGYVRLSTRSEQSIGAQLIERTQSQSGEDVYLALS